MNWKLQTEEKQYVRKLSGSTLQVEYPIVKGYQPTKKYTFEQRLRNGTALGLSMDCFTLVL